ncbi:hypothetical protein ACOMHN_034717 [Nucella lapillus]
MVQHLFRERSGHGSTPVPGKIGTWFNTCSGKDRDMVQHLFRERSGHGSTPVSGKIGTWFNAVQCRADQVCCFEEYETTHLMLPPAGVGPEHGDTVHTHLMLPPAGVGPEHGDTVHNTLLSSSSILEHTFSSCDRRPVANIHGWTEI